MDTPFARRYGGSCTVGDCNVVRDYHRGLNHQFRSQHDLALEKAWKRRKALNLWVRRVYGIGCNCPVGADTSGRTHHWACGTNDRSHP